MATFTAIPEKTQSATAMKRVVDYVMQDKKISYNGIRLVSGQNCLPESAYQEFMATKHQYSKTSGVFFKQYVQSFKPDCGATPEQIHQIGLELAKSFDGFEVVVATHIDRDHWHNHFVVNSVNCETGLKIQINEKGLEQLRRKSDEICQWFGLEVLKPYQKPKQKSLNQREYRAALRGNSKKLKLTNAIDYAVAVSRSKAQFIDQMKKLGYGVKWIEHYKYITYTTPDGQRFRDNRLLDEQTAAALTEPIQPTYLLLKPEQYNLIAKTISATGQAIVQSTDLISELPTHQDLNDLIIRTLRPNASEIREIVDRRTDSLKYSVEEKLSKQTESLTHILDRKLSQMMTEMKAKDLTPWKLKLKWISIGAILPSILLIWQLIFR